MHHAQREAAPIRVFVVIPNGRVQGIDLRALAEVVVQAYRPGALVLLVEDPAQLVRERLSGEDWASDDEMNAFFRRAGM